MQQLIKANEHFRKDHGWLNTFHHFSFGEYRNPDKMNYGPLRVFNDDIVQPAQGFDFHPHEDMEIVTYVIDGTLEHKDNFGNHGIISAGGVQRMSAGAMLIMIFAGLAGTGLLSVFTEGKLGPKDPAIMDSFVEPIGGFVALLAIGVVCGGMCFILAYRNNS